MSQSQFPYNTFQANPQSQIYNINPNQDVAYTQQQAYPAATQFQYSINNQETVMMQMNPFQQSFNNIITSVNQNQTKVKKDDKDIQNIMPNKQENPKLPKQSPPMKLTNEINNRSNSVKSKTSAKNKAAEKSIDEIKLKLDSISTALPSDPLDLERNSGVPDFIKKLYRLLEDQGYQSLISWGENGDTFVVKDQTEFSRKVLPKHFKHNNFASFVRQLNKYDFHKVKVDKTNSFGENIWEFKHPYFQFNRKDQLELIKRKISNKNPKPTEQKQSNLSPDIQQQVNNLIEIGSALASNVGQLTTNYSDFSKDYIPPEGWTAIGLKVASIYDGGNDAWLGTGNNKGEWYIGYHGVKSIDAIHGICVDGFRRGSGQVYKDDVNINPLTNKQFPKCGEGVYFTNDIEEAKKYTLPIDYNGNKYRIVFMCRVNPYKVRIASLGDKKEYWIVEGDKLGDLYGKKRSDERQCPPTL